MKPRMWSLWDPVFAHYLTQVFGVIRYQMSWYGMLWIAMNCYVWIAGMGMLCAMDCYEMVWIAIAQLDGSMVQERQ